MLQGTKKALHAVFLEPNSPYRYLLYLVMAGVGWLLTSQRWFTLLQVVLGGMVLLGCLAAVSYALVTNPRGRIGEVVRWMMVAIMTILTLGLAYLLFTLPPSLLG